MKELEKLDQQINDRLAAQKHRHQKEYQRVVGDMHEYERRLQAYASAADRLVRTVIRPRLERLASRFDHAELQPAEQTGHQCALSFRQTTQFPATAKLELGVNRDGQADHLFVTYNPSILPAFVRFGNSEQLTFPIDQVDDGWAAAWVEEKILSFLDAYLQLETIDQYQSENLVTDPVCGMRVNRLFAAAQADYRGRTYYFCVPACRDKFVAAPEAYLDGGKGK
jgi:YHS domain-containing protein